MNRRTFLRTAAIAGAVAPALPGILARSTTPARVGLSMAEFERILADVWKLSAARGPDIDFFVDSRTAPLVQEWFRSPEIVTRNRSPEYETALAEILA